MRAIYFLDYCGNKSTLENRLGKISEIETSLSDAEIKLKALRDHVECNTSTLPTRAREAMDRDLENLKQVIFLK